MGLNSTEKGIPRLGKVNRKVARNNRKDILSQEPLMPTTHRPLLPTHLFHPKRVHLQYYNSIGYYTSLTLGFNNKSDQNSQSSVAATGLPPGELTSSAHSLTWREFLTCMTTCFFTLAPQHIGKVMEAIENGRGKMVLTGQYAGNS